VGLVGALLGALGGCGLSAEGGFYLGNNGSSGGGAAEPVGTNYGGAGGSTGDDPLDGSLPAQPPADNNELMCAPPALATFFVSADDSNSMGSFGLVRELLRAGLLPPPARVRAYEFLNYLNLRAVPAPGEGHEPITTVHVHALPLGPDGKPRFSALLLGHAPLVAREPLDLTLVVDNSGSMVGEGLARTLEGIRSLAGRLRTGDTLSVVAYAEEAQVVLARTTIGDVEAFVEGTLDQEVLPALVPSGGSNLSAALELAYGELVGLGSQLGRTRRVMLFSDGGANVGVTSVDKIAAQAAAGDELGVFLTGVGVGPGPGYDDALMNELTDAGRGAYVYLDTLDEAERLGDRIDELTGVALRDVRFEIDVPEGVRIESSSAEQLGQVPELVRPQYVAPGDTLAVRFVLVQETAECLSEIYARLTWNDGVDFVAATSTPRLDTAPTTESSLEAAARLAVELAEALKSGAELALLAKEITELAAATSAGDPAKGALDELAVVVEAFVP
jgi:Ca-activated chloride channel family protein